MLTERPDHEAAEQAGRAALVTDANLSRRQRRTAKLEARQEARERSSRFAVVHDVDGPRVRLGLVWFVVALVAVIVGTTPVAALFGVVAAVAALQAITAWREIGVGPNRIVGGALTAAMPLAASYSVGLLGATVLALVLGSIIAGAIDRTRTSDPIVDAGFTIRCTLFVGLAAAAMVVLHRIGVVPALVLLLLVCAYDAGDYLVGSGSANSVEGPIAGMAGVAVVGFAVSVIEPDPFSASSAMLLAMMAAVLCPLGQLLVSAILPAAQTRAPAMRRLDAFALSAPVWAVILWWTTGLSGA